MVAAPSSEMTPFGIPAFDILVVDDDVDSLLSLEDFLGLEGHRIHTATRGREAVGLARRFRAERRSIQLSILDVHVPDMSGLDTYRHLAEMLPNLAAIFISGDCSHELETSVQELAGTVLLAKPLDLDRMRRAIASCAEDFFGEPGDESSGRAT